MIRISIVEDTKDIRETIQKRLEKVEDMVCISFYENAEDALKGLPKDKPDVVLMDIGLPNMDGIECMFRVKHKHPEINFLMFTVFDDDKRVFNALKAGAGGYVLKMEPGKKIIEFLRELYNGGAPMSRAIASRVLQSFHISESPVKEKLSARELEILEKLAQGLLYKEIAAQISPQVTEGTIKQHIHNIYKKLQVNNRTEAINQYLGNNL